MSEMVERVARALLHAECSRRADETKYGHLWGWDDAMPAVRERHLNAARAAIGALMEPTEGMVEAGAPAFKEVNDMIAFCHARGSHPGGLLGGDPMRKAWSLMLQAALSPPEQVE